MEFEYVATKTWQLRVYPVEPRDDGLLVPGQLCTRGDRTTLVGIILSSDNGEDVLVMWNRKTPEPLNFYPGS